MNLFNKNDVININNNNINNDKLYITKSKEILLNVVVNKNYCKILKNIDIITNKKMFCVKKLFKEFSENFKTEHTRRRWVIYLNNYCINSYNLKIYELCIILGDKLYYLLKNPYYLLNYKTNQFKVIKLDSEDIEIIENSIKYYNITKEDCINWVYQLLVYRIYKKGNAEKTICNILKELLKNYINKNNIYNIRLSNSNENIKGIDLVIELKNKSILYFQIKRHSFSKYNLIKENYSNNHNNIYYIYYHIKNNNYEIVNIKEIINIIKKYI